MPCTGTWLALAGGIWFVVGQTVSTLWNDGAAQAGTPNGGSSLRAIEELGFFYGLGALIAALAAFALGRLAVRSVRDAAYEERFAATDTAPATATADTADPETGRFTRDQDVEEAPPRRRFRAATASAVRSQKNLASRVRIGVAD